MLLFVFQVEVINLIIRTLWPKLTAGIVAELQRQLEPLLEQVVREKGKGYLTALKLELLDCGAVPVRLDGIKTYDTKEDELIIEAPVVWGSQLKVRVG